MTAPDRDDAVDAAATRLWEAMASGVPCAPVRDLIGADDVDLAYRVQRTITDRLRRERGWQACGHKIGLTSPAVQRQLGVDRPDFGLLFSELSHEDGSDVPVSLLMQPRVEAEVALVLAHDLDQGTVTPADVLAATDHIVPALEIVDSRVAGWDITIADTVADNASAGRFVLGASRTPAAELAMDLADVAMSMTYDGTEVSAGSGRDCLGSPLLAACWLATTLSAAGVPLRAGDVVLTGALGPMVPVRPGRVEADLGPLGRVAVTFVDGDGGPR